MRIRISLKAYLFLIQSVYYLLLGVDLRSTIKSNENEGDISLALITNGRASNRISSDFFFKDLYTKNHYPRKFVTF